MVGKEYRLTGRWWRRDDVMGATAVREEELEKDVCPEQISTQQVTIGERSGMTGGRIVGSGWAGGWHGLFGGGGVEIGRAHV